MDLSGFLDVYFQNPFLKMSSETKMDGAKLKKKWKKPVMRFLKICRNSQFLESQIHVNRVYEISKIVPDFMTSSFLTMCQIKA